MVFFKYNFAYLATRLPSHLISFHSGRKGERAGKKYLTGFFTALVSDYIFEMVMEKPRSWIICVRLSLK